MDRNEYLTRCRECAKITARIMQLRWQQAVPKDLLVYVEKKPYIPYCLKLWFDKDGKFNQNAELIDAFAFGCLVTVDLKEVNGGSDNG